jgi:hypothetical protein
MRSQPSLPGSRYSHVVAVSAGERVASRPGAEGRGRVDSACWLDG